MSDNLPVAEKRANTDWHIRTRQGYFKRVLKETMDANEMLVYLPVSLVDRMAYVTAFDEMMGDIFTYLDRTSKGVGRHATKQDKKVLEMTRNGKMVSHLDLKKEGISRVTIARMVVDGMLAHIPLGEDQEKKLRDDMENEGTEIARKTLLKREGVRMYSRGVCSEFADVINSMEYQQHYDFFEALSKAPVTVLENDDHYEYRMFGDDPNSAQTRLRFLSGSILKANLQRYLDMGMLEFRKGRLFMTDVGKHVHGYSKYCKLTKSDMFDSLSPEKFVEWIEKLDGIPESYKGVPKNEIIKLIKEHGSVGKLTKNELMDGLAMLEERPLSAIEEDVVLKLRLNKIYDKDIYGDARKEQLALVKEGIEESKRKLVEEKKDYLDWQKIIENELEQMEYRKECLENEGKPLMVLKTYLLAKYAKRPGPLRKRLAKKAAEIDKDFVRKLSSAQKEIESARNSVKRYALNASVADRYLAQYDAMLANLEAGAPIYPKDEPTPAAQEKHKEKLLEAPLQR
jgi:hypothetical protein